MVCSARVKVNKVLLGWDRVLKVTVLPMACSQVSLPDHPGMNALRKATANYTNKEGVPSRGQVKFSRGFWLHLSHLNGWPPFFVVVVEMVEHLHESQNC